MTVAVVWTLGPLHWITLGYVFDSTIFPNNATDSMVVSIFIGYLVVFLCSVFQNSVKQLSQKYELQGRYDLCYKLFNKSNTLVGVPG